ncbi:MAG: hypothetical protein IID16_11180 [Candidatus Marinimicrobia bacterium]|nr:hypothetical protein [Candidatus Neomarinimicrobiota bacterium]
MEKLRDEHLTSRRGEKAGRQADHTLVWASLNRDTSQLTSYQSPITNIKPQLKQSSKKQSIIHTVNRI